MSNLRSTIDAAQAALNQGRFADAEAIILPVWEAHPDHREVYLIYKDACQHQEKWDDTEKAIQRYAATPFGSDSVEGDLLDLYLRKKDAPSALKIAGALIEKTPDFEDQEVSLGHQFREAGLDVEYLAYFQAFQAEGWDKNLFFGRYYGEVAQAPIVAIRFILEGLVAKPGDETLQYYLKRYRGKHVEALKITARKVLSKELKGDAVQLYRDILTLEPNNPVAQEYYLVARVCRIFPPFSGYFAETNFMGFVPLVFKPVIYFIFFLVCALYYKGSTPVDGPDHLKLMRVILAAAVIPRYLLLPLCVQALAPVYARGYHLLKRPYHFAIGVIILLSWSFMAFSVTAPTVHGFQFFMAGAFLFQAVLFYIAASMPAGWAKNALTVYAVFSTVIAVLSFVEWLPDTFKFFIFAGWLPPVLLTGVVDWWKDFQHKRGRKPV